MLKAFALVSELIEFVDSRIEFHEPCLVAESPGTVLMGLLVCEVLIGVSEAFR